MKLARGAPSPERFAARAALLCLEIELEPTLEEVSATTAALHDVLPQRLPEDERQMLEVGVAEVLTNIVEHGYGYGPGSPIVVSWVESADRLEVTVADRGRPLPVGRLAAAGPATFDFDPTDWQSLPESGMGLSLIRMAFDSLDYARRDGQNRLRLVKRIG